MSDHLPECTLPKGHGDCICGELREAEQRGFHRGYRTAVDYWRTVSTRYGKRKYREGREDAARDVEALRNRWNGQHDVVQLTAAVAEARGEKS